MDLDDTVTIVTPEGVELRVVLAGAGSRALAGAVDVALQLVLLLLAALAAFGLVGGGVGTALFAVAAFAIVFGYYVAFELLSSGRTAGKHLAGLRAVRAGGGPIDLPASAVRTLLRLIDMLPSFYLLGLVCIAVTRRNQRLGDLAAGTLVVRQARAMPRLAPSPSAAAAAAPGALAGGARWDTSAVNAAELAAVGRFLERRHTLDAGARRELARRLADGLRAKVAGAPAGGEPERFLEALAEVKSVRHAADDVP